MNNIRDQIIAVRQQRLASPGYDEAAGLPQQRSLPLTPFLSNPQVICEIKRQSPSKGIIHAELDPVKQAQIYVEAGIKAISVLTEPSGFGGSLTDLFQVKSAFPGISCLRKDFLLNLRDVDNSYRAGADAILLIAAILPAETLAAMYNRAKELGMEVLTEIHNVADIAKIRHFSPRLVGINSRNLTNFRLDPLHPLLLRAYIDWPANVVYESGIHSAVQASWVRSCGFHSLLIGEATVRNPTLAAQLPTVWKTTSYANFWPRLAQTMNRHDSLQQTPLIKICGLTQVDDAKKAIDAGADLLGFVFYPQSPRCASTLLLRELSSVSSVLKIGVVVDSDSDFALKSEISRLLQSGLLDGLQMHGQSCPEQRWRLSQSHYSVLKEFNTDNQDEQNWSSPRTLLDAVGQQPGGNGMVISHNNLQKWNKPLWLAGGLNPDNVADLVARYQPELIDVASGVESSPGKKDAGKLQKFITAARAKRDNYVATCM